MVEPVDPFGHVPRWVSDLVTTVAVVLFTFLPVGALVPPGRPLAATLVGLASVLVLPARRRFPLDVLGICVGLAAVVAALGTWHLGLDVAIAIAMFQVGTRVSRKMTFTVGIVVVLVVTFLAIWGLGVRLDDPRVGQSALFVAFAAASGDGSRSRRAYIVAITRRAERAERSREAEAQRRVTEERLRIARDLHDAVAHQIAVISLNAGVASATVDTKPEKAKESLSTIRGASRTVLREIGDLMAMLRSEESAQDRPTPQPNLAQLDALVNNFAVPGLVTLVHRHGDVADVPMATSIVALRVVQEGLTNALKYSADGTAELTIGIEPDELTIVLTNPMGEHPSHEFGGVQTPSTGMGLLGLRERVASVRGSVRAGRDGHDWRLRARLPITKEETA